MPNVRHVNEQMMYTELTAGLLADAFPQGLRPDALEAAQLVNARLYNRQWTDRFEVQVGLDPILVPYRLYFALDRPAEAKPANIDLIIRCLESRSDDGFQRQRAVRELLTDIRPWSAPFIATLIGEYVIEILNDVHSALSPAAAHALAQFAFENPAFWARTKQRVASYWNVYYRAQFTRAGYVGFQLIDAIDSAKRCDFERTS